MRTTCPFGRIGAAAGAILLGACALAGEASAQGANAPSLMIIVDGSGSMWGAFDATRQGKSVLAREAVRAGLGKVAPQTRVGLAAFGHRRPGDCGDVEVLRAPEPLDADKIMAALAPINPRGRGPLTLALREAAKALPRDTSPGRLVLIHDDADNCLADLCDAANELKAAGIVAHVVGIGTKPGDMAKMACLPQVTGGQHFNAQTAAEVTSFVGEALRIASQDAGARKLQPRQPETAAVVPPPPIPASGPPELYLRAVPAPSTAPVDMPLRWIVSREGRPEVPVFNAWAANPVVPVAGGSYVVEASGGPISHRQTVTVGDRPAAVTLVLGAGWIHARVGTPKSNAALDTAIIAISKVAADGKKDALTEPPVAVFKAGEASALVPAGRYRVSAQAGSLRTEKTVTVAPGVTVPVDLLLNAGRLRLSTGAQSGQQLLASPLFLILEDDPDAPSGRREIARSATNPADFAIAPGTYYAVVRQGNVEARERLAISAGEAINRSLSISSSTLGLSSRVLGGGATARNISYTIERIDSAGQEPVVTSKPSPILHLPPGRYRVEGRYGLMNVAAVQEVDLHAGQMQELVFEHQTAVLRLRFQAGGPADVFWGILDKAGRTVWTSTQMEPVAVLRPGTYRISAETREKRYERQVDLGAGENRVVGIGGE